MVVGFNHNFRYKGEVYHIQTEDSGVKSPNIVTLLYQGGTILASKKTSYADIAKVDNLDQVVEELMKEQHKGMLRSLKGGEFDTVIERFQSGRQVTPNVSENEKTGGPRDLEQPVTAEPVPATSVEVPVEPVAAPQVVEVKKPAEVERPVEAEKTTTQAAPEEPQPDAATAKPSSAVEASLDEVILSYLMGDDK